MKATQKRGAEAGRPTGRVLHGPPARPEQERGSGSQAVTHPAPCPGVQVTVGEEDVAGSFEV